MTYIVEIEKYNPETWKVIVIKKRFDNEEEYNDFIKKRLGKQLEQVNDLQDVSNFLDEIKKEITYQKNEVFPKFKNKMTGLFKETWQWFLNKIQSFGWPDLEQEIIKYKDKINNFKNDLKNEIKKNVNKDYSIEIRRSLEKSLKELMDLKDAFQYLWNNDKVEAIKKEINKIKEQLKN